MKKPDNEYLCLIYNETKTGVKVTNAELRWMFWGVCKEQVGKKYVPFTRYTYSLTQRDYQCANDKKALLNCRAGVIQA
jgi:hypothetical protein